MAETQTESAPKDADKSESADKPKIPHKVTGEETKPGSLLVLSLEIPEEVVDSRVEEVLEDYRRQVTLPGFRKGKAPLSIVRARMAKHARGDALSKALPDIVEQIVEERNLTSLAEPKVDNLEMEEGAPITLDLTLEVKPEIELPALDTLSVPVSERVIDDALVGDQLAAIQRANALLQEKEGPVEKGDAATVDVEAIDHHGESVNQHAQQGVEVRTDDERHRVPDELAAALIGKGVGETAEAQTEMTLQTPPEEEGGEPGEEKVTWTWKATVREVKSVTLPDLDDEFAKDVGDFDSLDALRARVRKDLEEQEESRRRDEVVSGAIQQLLDQTSFDAPASLVSRAQMATLQRDMGFLKQQGMSFADLGETREDYWKNTLQEAEQRVRAELILDAVGQATDIEVTDADVDAEIERMAAQAGRKPLAIRAQLEARKQLDELRSRVERQKIAQHIVDTVKTTEAPPA